MTIPVELSLILRALSVMCDGGLQKSSPRVTLPNKQVLFCKYLYEKCKCKGGGKSSMSLSSPVHMSRMNVSWELEF